MNKSLFQIRKKEGKELFGVPITFHSVKGHSDTFGICTYYDMENYSEFDAIFDFGEYEKGKLFISIEDLIVEAQTNGCRYCKVNAR